MKKVLVIGAAKSGIAVSKLLAQNGYDVILNDRNEISDKENLIKLGIKVIDKEHPESLKNKDYEFIVKNPGIPYFNPFVKYFVDNDIKIYTEIEIAYWFSSNYKYGAITGTNGKTTITSMLYEILNYDNNAVAAGNIGTPLSEVVYLNDNKDLDVALELSNFQLLGIEKFRPVVSVISNLAPDHLDYMSSEESYYESKCNIYMNQKEEDYFLLNVDDELVVKYAKDIKCKVIKFSTIRKDVDLYIDNNCVYLNDTLLFDISILKVVGIHNISNAMVASCMALKMGISIEIIREQLSKFKAVEHRLEYVGSKNNVKYFNDSKATNTQAVETALKSFDNNIILLIGGYDKGIPFDPLKQYDSRIKQCIAFGQTKDKFNDIFSNVKVVEDIKEALSYANKITEENDVVLLSPACSSFDQFKSYEHRGRVFKELVYEFIGGK